MNKLEILLEDLKLRLPERDIKKAGEAILAYRELSEIPMSPLYPRGFQPLLLLKKRLGGFEKRVLVSPIELKIITNANMPAWRRIFEFDLDDDIVENTKIAETRALLIGKLNEIRIVKNLLLDVIPYMNVKPSSVYSLRNELFIKFGENEFIGLRIIGSGLEFSSYNIPLSHLSRILGRATFILDSLFKSKNAEFYRLLFVASLGSFNSFYAFFMRHIFPRLPLEHREFLEEMHDYKNFLQLLYFHLSRINIDRIQESVGVIIRRRSRPDRPLELEIIFRQGGVEVRDRIRRAQVELLV
ncbi:hypothetical protein PNA2_1978 [Pyrococcus sp. NA2]|uniref:hypothetical protein n=1 Tax=Pyrococcus sp. (strain NA2) TaxID=342949 RepID=UPI000209AEB2|nr:hypothetical protein [Pyrococcus sp. NA2]AEC52892.1 hypothetical protein PNA2_1978 [Pyrococcus sp. NA2]